MRNRPSSFVLLYLQLLQDTQLYVLQEKGPTKFIIEDERRCRYKVEIGNTVNCSCGGGVTEHCIHTVCVILILIGLRNFEGI